MHQGPTNWLTVVYRRGVLEGVAGAGGWWWSAAANCCRRLLVGGARLPQGCPWARATQPRVLMGERLGKDIVVNDISWGLEI